MIQNTYQNKAECKFSGKQHILVRAGVLLGASTACCAMAATKNKKNQCLYSNNQQNQKAILSAVMVVETIAAIDLAAKRRFAKFIIGEIR